MDVSELVGKARTGDVDAFTELVRRYQAMAFGYAYARLGDFHLAEDTAQQAFIAAWRGLDSLKEPERFGGWLRTIVRFESAHTIRSARVTYTQLDDLDGVSGHGPDVVAENREGLDRVLAAINALPQAEREVTILYYLQDRSQREVAAFLGVPVSTVNNRLRNARKHLKEGKALPMSGDALNEHRLPDDFAGRIGEIVRTQGPIIDARFPREHRPRVLNALTLTDDSGPSLLAEAIQHLDDSIVRCIVPEGRGFPSDASVRVTDTGGPVSVPLDHATVAEVIANGRETSRTSELEETGIKAIDLLCPLPRHGRVALVGDMHSGKVVLVEELIHRLSDTGAKLSLYAFVETPDEVATVNALEYRTSASIEAVYLPVGDSGSEALIDLLPTFDVVIAFSSHLARQRLYPAIDPERSNSRLFDSDVLAPKHRQTAERVRALLATDDPKADLIRRFLTQPFFVAEEWTRLAGAQVSLAETLQGCELLLGDTPADLDPDELYMTGALQDALPS